MTMSNAQMVNTIDVMSELNESGKLGYAIARNTRLLKEAATEYIDLRQKLFNKYGKSEGNKAYIPKENVQAFIDEMGDIPNIEHEVDIYQIPEDVFLSGSLDNRQMETLLWMVKED